MTYLPSSINSSLDLARLLNAYPPATDADAAEGPLDWGGLMLGPGETYEIDQAQSSSTRCVLAEVTAAVDFVEGGFGHDCALFTMTSGAMHPHWCPALYEQESYFDGEGVVTLDWREVYLAHGGYSETETWETESQARAHFAEQRECMAQAEADHAREVEGTEDRFDDYDDYEIQD